MNGWTEAMIRNETLAVAGRCYRALVALALPAVGAKRVPRLFRERLCASRSLKTTPSGNGSPEGLGPCVLPFLRQDVPVEQVLVLPEFVDDLGGVVWADAASGEREHRLLAVALDE